MVEMFDEDDADKEVDIDEAYQYGLDPIKVLTFPDKRAASFKIFKKPNSHFFIVKTTGPALPKELEGSYSSVETAEEIVTKYVKRNPATQSVQVKKNIKRLSEKGASKNASKTRTETDSNSKQGSVDGG